MEWISIEAMNSLAAQRCNFTDGLRSLYFRSEGLALVNILSRGSTEDVLYGPAAEDPALRTKIRSAAVMVD